MINYLISYIDKETGLNENQKKYLKKDLEGKRSIAFISSLPDLYDENDEKLQSQLGRLAISDITFDNAYLIDHRKNKNTAKKEIMDSDVVFLMGGDPYSEMEFIKEYELVDILKQKDFIIGVSAGAMIQAPRVVYRDEFNNDIIRDFEGLGLVGIYIFPHVDDEKIMEESHEMNEIYPNTPLYNSDFVRVENGNIEIVKQKKKQK